MSDPTTPAVKGTQPLTKAERDRVQADVEHRTWGEGSVDDAFRRYEATVAELEARCAALEALHAKHCGLECCEERDAWYASLPVSETPKPCPFCGMEPLLRDYGHSWRLECDTPGCFMLRHGMFGLRDLIVAGWNRRAVSEPCDCDQPREHAFVPQAANATLCAKCGSGPTHEDHRSPSSERVRTAPPQEDAERAQQLHRIEQRFFSSVMRAVHSASDLHFKGGVLAAINERREAIAGLPPLTGPKVIPSTPSSAPTDDTDALLRDADERVDLYIRLLEEELETTTSRIAQLEQSLALSEDKVKALRQQIETLYKDVKHESAHEEGWNDAIDAVTALLSSPTPTPTTANPAASLTYADGVVELNAESEEDASLAGDR